MNTSASASTQYMCLFMESYQVLKNYFKSKRSIERAYQREISRRKTAEDLLEEKSREAYLLLEKMKETNEELQSTLSELVERRHELSVMGDSYSLVKSDLELASTLQSELLPGPLERDRISALGVIEPAEYMAGDGIDYFFLGDNIFAFYVVDVVGHGVSSSMLSFAVHNRLNPQYDGICSLSLRNTENPEQAIISIMDHLNTSFYTDNERCMYFTMVLGLMEMDTGRVSIGQAGHPAPMHCSQRIHSVTDIGDGGPPIAMFDQAEFETQTFQMEPGDRLFAYSDGITECASPKNEEYGRDRLANKLLNSMDIEIVQVAREVRGELEAWNGPKDFADDVSMLIIEYR